VALLRQRLRRLARTELDLLFTGETGVGKEVYAQAVHRASGRRGPFVAVNCAALPEHLVESELFGYVRGAHSTAEQAKPGLVELAAGGTLFLDEIGEMPAAAQAKLLRFLQSRELVPLGATRARAIDLRVLAATHRAPAADEGEIGLRLDLLARLGPSAIRIPPLRDRLEDVGLLARQFLGGGARPFAPMAWASLFLRRWSGNVRALEKTMQFAAALANPDEPLEIEHLLAPPELTAPPPSTPQTRAARPTREDLVDLLTRHAGDVAQVARTLGRQRTLVWRWLRKEGVDPQGFRRPRPA
jgi:transcriptional regulator with PAS, ATPase and Fis domain